MKHTFTALAAALTLGLLASIGVGFWSFFLTDPVAKKDVFIVHFFLGLCTALGALLVHCIIFTYFLGTGRWVKEVGLAYGLPDQHQPRQTRELKRATFPPALFAMLTAIATTAAGAGAQLQEWPWQVHATLAFVTLGVNLWAFRVEHRNVRANAAVIAAVLDEVDRIRAARGLPPNAEALLEDGRPEPLHVANGKPPG